MIQDRFKSIEATPAVRAKRLSLLRTLVHRRAIQFSAIFLPEAFPPIFAPPSDFDLTGADAKPHLEAYGKRDEWSLAHHLVVMADRRGPGTEKTLAERVVAYLLDCATGRQETWPSDRVLVEWGVANGLLVGVDSPSGRLPVTYTVEHRRWGVPPVFLVPPPGPRITHDFRLEGMLTRHIPPEPLQLAMLRVGAVAVPQISGWAEGIRPGDYLLVENPDQPDGDRYRVLNIRYRPTALHNWRADVEAAPLWQPQSPVYGGS